MSSPIAIAIAIPYYSGLGYLREAIESVRRQSDPHWTLLVCDDSAGEEDAGALVRGFDDVRIRYQRNRTNLGMVENWNACLDHVAEAGQQDETWLTILHADDRLLAGYVELMKGLADRHGDACALFCAAKIIGPGGAPRFSFADAVKRLFQPSGSPVVLRGEEALTRLMAGNFIMCPTLCYRLSSLGNRRFDPRWSQVQDLELTSRILLEDGTLVGTPECAFEYRRHAASATARQSESLLRFREEFQLFAEVAKNSDARGWPHSARVARRSTIVKIHLAYRSLIDLILIRPGAAVAKWRLLAERRN